MINAGTGKIGNLNDSRINLNGWKFSIDPREDWKQIFTDAWRMERDYFYDKNMHGVNWKAMHDKYYPPELEAYARRDPERMVRQAKKLGNNIGRFMSLLLSGVVPWGTVWKGRLEN